ncbi:hypothetical protein LWI28_012062 [Acer negundo]|uniref:Uncharacterized protein n=1 Tax=Acer negundo TaxID=4023 RepID=A0AAD5J963_ACENE|nr:hypothetical protein LWI28_012062 [Acer negundo]
MVEAVRILTGLPFQLSSKRIPVSTETPDLQGYQLHIIFFSTSFSSGKTYGCTSRISKEQYIMLNGVNDEELHAHQLGKLLETFQANQRRRESINISENSQRDV